MSDTNDDNDPESKVSRKKSKKEKRKFETEEEKAARKKMKMERKKEKENRKKEEEEAAKEEAAKEEAPIASVNSNRPPINTQSFSSPSVEDVIGGAHRQSTSSCFKWNGQIHDVSHTSSCVVGAENELKRRTFSTVSEFESKSEFVQNLAICCGEGAGSIICESKGDNRYEIHCHRQGQGKGGTSKKCRCGFRINLNWNTSQGKFIVSKMSLMHNHDLARGNVPPTESLPLPSYTKLVTRNDLYYKSKEIEDLVSLCLLRGVGTPHQIINHVILQLYPLSGVDDNEKCKLLGPARRFVINIISCKKKSMNFRKNSTEFLNWLENNRYRFPTVKYLYGTEGECSVVKGVFVQSTLMVQNCIDYFDAVVIDATNLKNDSNFPLVLVVGINREGKTVTLGAAIVPDETTLSYQFVMRCTKENDSPIPFDDPLVTFSDEDSAIVSAMKIEWPTTLAFRCDYHFSENIKTWLRQVLNQKEKAEEGVNTILTKFNEARYCTDEETFDTAWTAFFDFIGTHAKAAQLTSYFTRQYNTRGRWAHFARAKVLTFDMNSSQRVESKNARVQALCNRMTTLGKEFHVP